MSVIIDYKNDGSFEIGSKEIYCELLRVKQLKENDLWWEEDEKDFVEKYGMESDIEKLLQETRGISFDELESFVVGDNS